MIINTIKDKSFRNMMFLSVILIFFAFCWVSVHGDSPFYCALYVAASVILFLLFWMCWVLYKKNRINYTRIYPAIALAVGLIYLIQIPIYTVPDEQHHLWVSYHLSNVMLGIEDDWRHGDLHLQMRSEDDAFEIKTNDYDTKSFEEYLEGFSEEGDTKIVNTHKVVVSGQRYPYFLSSLAITIGRLLRVSSLELFLSGRLVNLLLFIAVTTLSIWLLPYGKELMFCIALLPMTVQQSMSYSYDSWVISHCFLIVALFLNLRESKKWEKKEYIKYGILTAVCFLMLPIKSHAYCLFIILPLLLAIERYKGRPAQSIVEKVIRTTFIISFVVLVAVVLFGEFIPFIPSTTSTLTYTDGAGYTVGYLLNHTDELVRVIYNTVHNQLDDYYTTSIGNLLGWLEIPMNDLLVAGYAVLLILATIQEKAEPKMDGLCRKVFLQIGIFTILGINVGMLLLWSPISAHEIVGVQGRYFIPVMLPLFLSMKTWKVTAEKELKDKIPMLLLVLQFFTLDQLMCF